MTDTAQVARTLNEFEQHYNQIAKPFDWNFTANTSPTYSTASTNANEILRSHSRRDLDRDPGGLRCAAGS